MKSRLPSEFLQSLRDVPGFNEQSFVDVHEHSQPVVSIRINPAKFRNDIDEIFPGAAKVPWCSYGYYLPERPSFTLDPLLHAGVYYVQEASSMFIGQCVAQHCNTNSPLSVLDLCAAPGGKSTLLQSIISTDSLLVSNEVIKTRVPVLIENVVKWGGANVVVTNNDPADFSRVASMFDVMVVDAPCSGSGLFRRDRDAIGEWSEDAVRMCSLRQQRILTDAWDSLKRGGLLVYSTCSYSKEEDEQICDWLMDNFAVSSLKLDVPQSWNIVESASEKYKAAGYRFFPDRLNGEGFFVACFRKDDGNHESVMRARKSKLLKASASVNVAASAWLRDASHFDLYDHDAQIFAVPAGLGEWLYSLHANLYVKKAGIRLGKVMHNELVPEHELAVSGFAANNLQRISLKKEEAIQYLRKDEVTLQTTKKGWALVEYRDVALGWMKLLGNRHNNYYPKEWRILKSGNN